MAGDHFRHCHNGVLKRFGLHVGVAADLHADEHREAKTEPVSLQHGSIGFDVTVALQPLDPAQAGRRREANLLGEFQVGQAAVRLKRCDDAAVDRVQVRIWHKSLTSAIIYARYCATHVNISTVRKDSPRPYGPFLGPGNRPARSLHAEPSRRFRADRCRAALFRPHVRFRRHAFRSRVPIDRSAAWVPRGTNDHVAGRDLQGDHRRPAFAEVAECAARGGNPARRFRLRRPGPRQSAGPHERGRVRRSPHLPPDRRRLADHREGLSRRAAYFVTPASHAGRHGAGSRLALSSRPRARRPMNKPWSVATDALLPCQRALFDIPREVCFLNAASWSPLPLASQEAGRIGVARKGQPWKLGPEFAPAQYQRARVAAARLINADPEDVALISSVSYGVATAAKLFPVPAGARVLVLEDDHSSPVLEWMTRAPQQGFTVEVVPRPDDGVLTASGLAAIDRPGAPL